MFTKDLPRNPGRVRPPADCISDEKHDGKTNPVAHYFGCLDFCEREQFFKDLDDNQRQRIKEQLRRAKHIREFLAAESQDESMPNSGSGPAPGNNLVDDVNESLTAWRKELPKDKWVKVQEFRRKNHGGRPQCVKSCSNSFDPLVPAPLATVASRQGTAPVAAKNPNGAGHDSDAVRSPPTTQAAPNGLSPVINPPPPISETCSQETGPDGAYSDPGATLITSTEASSSGLAPATDPPREDAPRSAKTTNRNQEVEYSPDRDVKAYLIQYQLSNKEGEDSFIGNNLVENSADGKEVWEGTFPSQKAIVRDLLAPDAPVNFLGRGRVEVEEGSSSMLRYFHFPLNNMKVRTQPFICQKNIECFSICSNC